MDVKLKLLKTLASCAILLMFSMGGASASWAHGQLTTQNPVWFSPGLNLMYEIEGTSSKAVRTHNGFSVQFRTKELNAGEAYTLLVAIFNYPENCINGASYPWPDDLEPKPACSAADLMIPAVASDIVHLTGNLVGKSGRAAFAAYLEIGDTSNSILAPLFPTPGLLNPQGAEFHFVLTSHGQKIPVLMPDMISTYLGGCSNQPFGPLPNLPLPEWGERGPNDCVFQHEAFHAAPSE